MNLLEAIKGAQDTGRWFRPVSWKNYGEAFAISAEGDWTELVPTSKGGKAFMTSTIAGLMGEWELVTPEEVCNEKM